MPALWKIQNALLLTKDVLTEVKLTRYLSMSSIVKIEHHYIYIIKDNVRPKKLEIAASVDIKLP